MDVPHTPISCSDKDKCRLRYGAVTSTCMGYSPVYDGHGNIVAGEDPNSRYQVVRCDACKRAWTKTERRNSVTWDDHDY
jgi:hypothetical protein